MKIQHSASRIYPKTLLCVTLSETKGLKLQEHTEILRFAQNDKNCKMGFGTTSSIQHPASSIQDQS